MVGGETRRREQEVASRPRDTLVGVRPPSLGDARPVRPSDCGGLMKVEWSPGEELVTGGTGTWDRSQESGTLPSPLPFLQDTPGGEKGRK